MENWFDGKPVWKLKWFDMIWRQVQLGDRKITIDARMLLDSRGIVFTLGPPALSEIHNLFQCNEKYGDDIISVIMHWCDFYFVAAW